MNVIKMAHTCYLKENFIQQEAHVHPMLLKKNIEAFYLFYFWSLTEGWSKYEICRENKTRPDTRQYSRGRLGRSSNAKTARNSKKIRDGRTDRHGKV